jgi:hypothetical protein
MASENIDDLHAGRAEEKPVAGLFPAHRSPFFLFFSGFCRQSRFRDS